MMLTSGTVINGKIVVEGEPLKEGATVTVLTPEPGFELSAEEKTELLESIREADAGETISGEALLKELGAS